MVREFPDRLSFNSSFPPALPQSQYLATLAREWRQSFHQSSHKSVTASSQGDHPPLPQRAGNPQ
jgi:hypothetical protein